MTNYSHQLNHPANKEAKEIALKSKHDLMLELDNLEAELQTLILYKGDKKYLQGLEEEILVKLKKLHQLKLKTFEKPKSELTIIKELLNNFYGKDIYGQDYIRNTYEEIGLFI